MRQPRVAERLFGELAVGDNVIHDRCGSQALDAWQRSQPLAVELLESRQVGVPRTGFHPKKNRDGTARPRSYQHLTA